MCILKYISSVVCEALWRMPILLRCSIGLCWRQCHACHGWEQNKIKWELFQYWWQIRCQITRHTNSSEITHVHICVYKYTHTFCRRNKTLTCTCIFSYRLSSSTLTRYTPHLLCWWQWNTAATYCILTYAKGQYRTRLGWLPVFPPIARP